MENIKELKNSDYEKYKSDDRFIHNMTYPINCADSKGVIQYTKAMTKYTIAKQEFKVSKEQIQKATQEYNKRKQNIIKNIKNKLVFVGMGMDFKPLTNNHIGNHRIRTYFKNNQGVLCFVEFGTTTNKDFMRCDHALMNTKREWTSLNEREQEKRISILESMQGDYTKYTKENILKLVNKNCDCNFKEVEVYNYFIGTDDYTSISKKRCIK